ncbi:hypothetical protein SEA_SONALI_70 [Arthrobacter phage Sonali]|uniref:Uncharacterized protein n=1 Tax=Arthrobacter phage Sonali TaxID=2510495 RepID=A0A411CQS6_9CAUD|nr:hypothetical protein HOV09_gp70 [Arthrobacter phage Sonali]QAY16182.1 hypothetical protein SEA_SONALI_70 [Arthrobacter phage Sonali]
MIHEPKPTGKRLECSAPGCGFWLIPHGPTPPGGWDTWFQARHDNFKRKP